MAKLVRKTQKIFASGSAQNQVTSFGSIKAGAVDYTKDVADIQTEAFEGGWSSAVQDDYAPYRQDRNAVDFVTTSQLAYVFQEGLPEYDAGTTYYKGSWVKGNDGDAFSIYESLSDDNIGNALSDEEKWEKKSFGGGLEIGDIGIAPFGVDEAQNKRRYLNGQVISQAQFESFTNKVKTAIQLNPSLATSETNWQAEVTNSVLGQCGKFVIDDALGTIRLPKVVNINGLQDLALMGGIKAESLPNIRGDSGFYTLSGQVGGAFYRNTANKKGNEYNVTGQNDMLCLDASGYSSTYQDNAPVQQEAIQYPYFIQVATGTEESVDVTREIELNNPFSLLDYKWSEYEITNASWLLSNGQFNSGATYISVYNLLLEIYNGTVAKEGVSVKLHEQQLYGYSVSSTESRYFFETENVQVGQVAYSINLEVVGKVTSVSSDSITVINYSSGASLTLTRNTGLDRVGSIYTDTDFVINTEDTTFRLPVKVKLASGNAVVGNGMTLGLDNGYELFGLFTSANDSIQIGGQAGVGQNVGYGTRGLTTSVNRYAGITTDPTKSGIETSSSGLKLYFYVGETIQDANVIAASQVLTTVADCVRKSSATDRATVVGWGIPDYNSKISINSGYVAPCAGCVSGTGNFNSGVGQLYVNGIAIQYVNSASNAQSSMLVPVDKNDKITFSNIGDVYFYPFKGVN